MPYQTFAGEKGDSDSPAKLAAIKLPEDLTGKRVLDLGCAEGFFCQEAKKRGADEVIGIDTNPKAVEEAKLRVPEATFVCGDWWDAPGRDYDVILFLSGLHYEPRQKMFLDFLRTRLAPDGLLILECGTQWSLSSKEWVPVQRHNGVLRYPTFPLLVDDLLSSYATRDLGPSVQQAGDPMRRFVFHCRPLKPTVLVIGGKSKRGKTVLARELGRSGSPVLHMDFVLGRLHSEAKRYTHPFVKYLEEKMTPNQVDIFCQGLIRDGKIPEFLNFLANMISVEDSVTILEGYVFETLEMQTAVKDYFEKRGFIVAEVVL